MPTSTDQELLHPFLIEGQVLAQEVVVYRLEDHLLVGLVSSPEAIALRADRAQDLAEAIVLRAEAAADLAEAHLLQGLPALQGLLVLLAQDRADLHQVAVAPLDRHLHHLEVEAAEVINQIQKT